MNKEVNEFNRMLGLKLKLKRKSLGLTQDKLGKCLGLTFQQIQKYEKGVNNITIANLYKLSKILNTDISYFINDDNNNIISSIRNNSDNLRETEELAKVIEYYNRIKDKKIRNTVLEIIKSLGKVESERQE